MKIALYQPDIAGNVGTIMRMCACLNMGLDIIEPCGFPFNDKKIKRSSMDYYDFVNMNKFNSFDEFRDYNKNSRIVLLTTKSSLSCYDFEFKNDDILLAGRESAGRALGFGFAGAFESSASRTGVGGVYPSRIGGVAGGATHGRYFLPDGLAPRAFGRTCVGGGARRGAAFPRGASGFPTFVAGEVAPTIGPFVSLECGMKRGNSLNLWNHVNKE